MSDDFKQDLETMRAHLAAKAELEVAKRRVGLSIDTALLEVGARIDNGKLNMRLSKAVDLVAERLAKDHGVENDNLLLKIIAMRIDEAIAAWPKPTTPAEWSKMKKQVSDPNLWVGNCGQ